MLTKFGLRPGHARMGAVLRRVVLAVVSAGTVGHAEPPNLFTQISVKGIPTCTGSTVMMSGKRYLVTAAHCLTKLEPYDTIEVSEGAALARGQIVSRLEVTEFRVGDAVTLRDFDVSMWELKVWQLARTRTLTPRLTELTPSEAVLALGYPGGHDATTLACRNISGNLVTVDGSSFQPAQSMTCATEIPRLGGLSGGPALDANGRYLGVIDYQSPSGQAGQARVGFVPYRVFKPYDESQGSRRWGGLRYGYTFTDYLASGNGRSEVTVIYVPHLAEGNVIGADVELITVRAPDYVARATLTEPSHRPVRLNVTLTGADGRVRTLGSEDLYAPSYLTVRSAVRRLRE